MRRLRTPTPHNAAVGMAGLAALVALAGFLLVVRPKQSEAAKLRSETAAVQARLSTARSRANGRPQPVSAAELVRVAQAMPDAPDMPGVLLELNGLADATGITLKSVTPSVPKQQSGYRTLPITLLVEGDYYGLTDFLYRMRTLVAVRHGALVTSGRLFSVDAISFGPGSAGFPAVKASVDVSAFAYGSGAAGTGS